MKITKLLPYVLIYIALSKVISKTILKSDTSALAKENEALKKIIEKQSAQLKILHKAIKTQCADPALTRLFSFLELNSREGEADPLFKTMTRFYSPRAYSFIAKAGDKDNKEFAFVKTCPPGCVVGGMN